jgi:hypothetical protein
MGLQTGALCCELGASAASPLASVSPTWTTTSRGEAWELSCVQEDQGVRVRK